MPGNDEAVVDPQIKARRPPEDTWAMKLELPLATAIAITAADDVEKTATIAALTPVSATVVIIVDEGLGKLAVGLGRDGEPAEGEPAEGEPAEGELAEGELAEAVLEEGVPLSDGRDRSPRSLSSPSLSERASWLVPTE